MDDLKLVTFRDPTLLRGFYVAFGVFMIFASAVFAVAVVSVEKGQWFLVVTALSGVAQSILLLRMGLLMGIQFSEDYVVSRTAFRTHKVNRSEIVGFFKGASRSHTRSKLGISLLDGSAVEVPVDVAVAKSKNFRKLLRQGRLWLDA